MQSEVLIVSQSSAAAGQLEAPRVRISDLDEQPKGHGLEHFQTFLRRLRRSYPGRQVWLVLNEAAGHIAPRSRSLAVQLECSSGCRSSARSSMR